MSTLASVYHKPAGTFIGLGRIGADSVQKKEECVFIDPNLSTRAGPYARSLVCSTINSPRKRRSKLSRQVNRLRTFSTSTTFLQINRLDWLLRKFPPPYLRLRALLRALRQTHSTTSSPSSETWVPHNRHKPRWLQGTCLVHNLHHNPSSSRIRSVGWDWGARLPLLRSLPRHHNRHKSRRMIC